MAKRRANGEGNIRKRKDGRWEGRYTAGRNPATGKAIYKNVLGKTQAEVKEKLKKAIEEAKGLDVAKGQKYTVGQWMDVWYEYYAQIKVRPSSHKTYEGYIRNHIKPSIGAIPLPKLTALDLQKFYQKLLTKGRVERKESEKQAKGLSPKTVRNINQVISSAMQLAIQQHLISHDPTDGCALPKTEHREMQTLSADQLTAFLLEANTPAFSRCTTSSWQPDCDEANCWGSNGRISISQPRRSECAVRWGASTARCGRLR